MSKTILVKAESFYTFLEKNVLGYQKKEDNSMRVCGVASVFSHDIFQDNKQFFVYVGNDIEADDAIVFEFSEYNYFLQKNVNYYAIFNVEGHDSILLNLIPKEKGFQK